MSSTGAFLTVLVLVASGWILGDATPANATPSTAPVSCTANGLLRRLPTLGTSEATAAARGLAECWATATTSDQRPPSATRLNARRVTLTNVRLAPGPQGLRLTATEADATDSELAATGHGHRLTQRAQRIQLRRDVVIDCATVSLRLFGALKVTLIAPPVAVPVTIPKVEATEVTIDRPTIRAENSSIVGFRQSIGG